MWVQGTFVCICNFLQQNLSFDHEARRAIAKERNKFFSFGPPWEKWTTFRFERSFEVLFILYLVTHILGVALILASLLVWCTTVSMNGSFWWIIFWRVPSYRVPQQRLLKYPLLLDTLLKNTPLTPEYKTERFEIVKAFENSQVCILSISPRLILSCAGSGQTCQWMQVRLWWINGNRNTARDSKRL